MLTKERGVMMYWMMLLVHVGIVIVGVNTNWTTAIGVWMCVVGNNWVYKLKKENENE